MTAADVFKNMDRASTAARAKFGLDDSWSVVEMRPEGARRAFLVTLHSEEYDAKYYGRLGYEEIDFAANKEGLR